MPTILYVEDDRLTRESIAARLSRRGWDVVEAQSGEEALERADGIHQFAVVLLDFELPGIDGIETLCRLKETDPNLPVVFCSGRMDEAIREKLTRMGVPRHCLLSKPCRFQEVLKAVQTATNCDDGSNGSFRAK